LKCSRWLVSAPTTTLDMTSFLRSRNIPTGQHFKLDYFGVLWHFYLISNRSHTDMPTLMLRTLRCHNNQLHRVADSHFVTYNKGCGRNSELIINKNNILLKVTDTNFSTSRFTMVLNLFFLHSFTFCVQYLLGGHHPPQCTGAQS